MIGALKGHLIKQKKKWQLINKPVGKCSTTDNKIEVMTETGIETNPQKVAELLKAYFVETVEELIKQNNYLSHTETA